MQSSNAEFTTAPWPTSPKLKADAATLDTLAELAGIDCSIGEMAANFEVSAAEMTAFIRDTPEARAALKRGYDEGTERLQRACQRHAESAKTGKPKKRRSSKKQAVDWMTYRKFRTI